MNLVFKLIYWAGVVAEIAIRAPFQKGWKTTAKTDQRISTTERAALGLLALGSYILPLIYSLTNWLDFANYPLPDWLGWVGVGFMAGAVVVFARAHMDLKANWSPSLEVFKGHTLITNGIYRYIRHPMYASQWLWVIAQMLLLPNYIAGLSGLLVFIPFYFLRVRAEEQMMVETFGDQYRTYMAKTGGVIPKF